jgi:hypothetical protein
MSDYEEYETTNQSVDLTSFDVDFATAEAPEYDEVPDGKYQVRIESVKLESSQKGDPMIKFDLEVLSGSQFVLDGTRHALLRRHRRSLPAFHRYHCGLGTNG